MMMDSAAVGTPTADAFADEPPWTTLTVTARAFADGTPVHAARKRRFCAVMEGLANGGARGVYEAARCPRGDERVETSGCGRERCRGATRGVRGAGGVREDGTRCGDVVCHG